VDIQGEIIENFGNSVFQEIFLTMFFGTTKAGYPCPTAVGAHFSNVPWYRLRCLVFWYYNFNFIRALIIHIFFERPTASSNDFEAGGVSDLTQLTRVITQLFQSPQSRRRET